MSGDAETPTPLSNKLAVTVSNCAGSLCGTLIEIKHGKSKGWLYANDALRVGVLVRSQ